jgi:oligoendopeptidase F
MAPPAKTTEVITGPAWDLSDEYAGLDAPELQADIDSAVEAMAEMSELSGVLAPHLGAAREMSLDEAKGLGILDALDMVNKLKWASSAKLSNVYTFANCLGSVDGKDEGAKQMVSKVGELFSKHSQASQAATLFLTLCTDEVAHAFLNSSKEASDTAFLTTQRRKKRDNTLSLAEENMLSSYSVVGIQSFGTLYTDLSGTLTVSIVQPDGTGKKMGIAGAAGLLDSPDGEVRRRAWEGIKDAWLPHMETCAAALNAMVAWRLETYRRRGVTDFLETPLHQNNLERKSLDAMQAAVADGGVEVGRRALRIQAACLGKSRMEPWDLFAPAPVSAETATTYPYDEGIAIIANAVGKVDTKAGEFVLMMKERGWIEATSGDNKRPGAYCTGFSKSRNPRVYLSEYNGRASLLLTLAHELGHAYHAWVTRDMAIPNTSYGMNLAETASIFFETCVADALFEKSETVEEKFAISWLNAESAATFMLNISARFKFEYDLYTKRPSGKLSAQDLDNLMVEAWREYYGDALGSLNDVGVFSCSKLHFYISYVFTALCLGIIPPPVT